MYRTPQPQLQFLSDPMHLCRAYSEGRMGWRQAATLLGLDGYDALRTFVHDNGYPAPAPDIEASRATMERLEYLMYDEDER